MECVVLDQDGCILGRSSGGPSRNAEGFGMHPDVGAHVVHAIDAALRRTGLSEHDVAGVSLNLSGDPAVLTVENARRWLSPLRLPARCAIAIAVATWGPEPGRA